MTYFLRQGNTFRVTPEANIPIEKSLPLGTYAVMADMAGFYLNAMEPLRADGKVYGTAPQMADRIINTFQERPGNTGVILEGEKGGGKTFLARLMSSNLAKINIPTLLVNSQFAGEGFNTFIAQIDQPCMIFFDEFEKTYDKQHQNMLLTLFDGVYAGKKLFVVALNDSFALVDFFRNRPGRFFYQLKYEGLEEAFIKEYLEDNLKDKAQIPAFMSYTQFFAKFNFDMLKALVEEMNRYGESVGQSARIVNAKPLDMRVQMQVESLIIDGKELDPEKNGVTVSDNQPVNVLEPFHVRYAEKPVIIEEDDYGDIDAFALPAPGAKRPKTPKYVERKTVQFRGALDLEKVEEGKYYFNRDGVLGKMSMVVRRATPKPSAFEKYYAL